MNKTGTPEVILNCKDIFQKLVNPQVRDTLLTDMLDLAEDDDNDDDFYEMPKLISNHKIPEELKNVIQLSHGHNIEVISLLSHLTIKGITYSVSSQHIGNSSILLFSGKPGKYLPAEIQFIFQATHENNPIPLTLIAARRYKPISNISDPFAEFPYMSAQMWSPNLNDLKIYSTDDIHSHFAHLSLSWQGQPALMMISLSRVPKF